MLRSAEQPSSPAIVTVVGAEHVYPPTGYAWVTVILLTLAYVFSFIDRQIINLLVTPIRADLNLTDIEISYLLGPSFALIYTLIGLPLGRLVDRSRAVPVAAGGVAAWSVMTVLSGLAGGFGLLFMTRAGVAGGEAALSPAAHRVISDSFPPERRGRPLSIYLLGIWIGTSIAFLFGGLVTHAAPAIARMVPLLAGLADWRITFILVGLPGLLIAAAIATLSDPPRPDAQAAEGSTIGETLRYVVSDAKALLVCILGFSIVTMAGYCLLAWAPTMMVRRFGWSLPQVGTALGIATLVGGLGGTAIGGLVGDYAASRGVLDGKYRITAALAGFGILVAAVFGMTGDVAIFIVCFTCAVTVVATGVGIGPAAVQELVPNAYRGQIAAVFVSTPTVLGLGLGPPAVAFLSEKVLAQPNIGMALAIVMAALFALGSLTLSLGRASFRVHPRILQIEQVRLTKLAAGQARGDAMVSFSERRLS